MARRPVLSLILILALCLAFPFGSTAHGKQVRDSPPALCGEPNNQASFTSSSGLTQVIVCPSVVVTSHALRVLVHTRRATAVRVVIQYPDGSVSASPLRYTDGQGQIVFGFTIRYNPINRYVQAQITVLVGRNGQVDTVNGTITIAQGNPLGASRLRVHAVGTGGLDEGPPWCPADAAACVVHNNSQILIRVDTDPGAQVNVTLFYPDNQSASCPSNDLTGTGFASDTGVYRCELPVVFQPRGKRGSTTLLVVAQISSGSYSKPLSQKLVLVQS